ncbi:MAG: hypothetical protein A2Z01_09235 [Betaproteobacteria bacterium RBG_16_58_11]|nr:MAG: hypothetical protein A2Z01_09235 [Betaproteobacteria bacterium RBG_16_58_11]
MFRVIRLGDKTTHGGEVVSAAGNYKIMGKNVAREGDSCTCPIKGHGNCQIVGGDPHWKIDGRSVALQGISKTSCGAELISSCGELTRSFEGEGAASGGTAGAISGFAGEAGRSADLRDFDRQFQLIDQDGRPVDGIAVDLAAPNKQAATIKTDGAGKSPLVSGNDGETATLVLFQEANV